jgi:anti-sigma regulatory factor (Ser/Thr protein kinase)
MKNTTVLKIPSHPKYLRTVRLLTDEMGELYGMKANDIKSIKLAVDEACSNVIKHAYKEDTSKKIIIKFVLSPKGFEVIIEDNGIKVEPSNIKGRDFDDVRPGGLGTHFIKRAFDLVLFDDKKKKGNRLILVKYSSDGRKDTGLKGTEK